jgi:hypothetical protein
MRIVNGTASLSGPSITATFAPGKAGDVPHFRSFPVTNWCPLCCAAAGAAKMASIVASAAAETAGMILIGFSSFG